MPGRTKSITFRIAEELHSELNKRGSKLGQSPHGVAREMVIERIAAKEADKRGVLELQDQVQKLRTDLATATEALLTVIGGTKDNATRAAAWVRRNLNQ